MEFKVKIMFNENYEQDMRMEIKEKTQQFLHFRQYQIRDLLEEEIQFLKDMALTLTYLRAPAEFDQDGELINAAHPEMPTRILKQLKRLYLSLLSLDDFYDHKRAQKVIIDLIRSSSYQNRLEVYGFLTRNPKLLCSEYRISQALSIGRKSVRRELNVLWNMGLVRRDLIEERNSWGKEQIIITWQLLKILPSLYLLSSLEEIDSRLDKYPVSASFRDDENIMRTFSKEEQKKEEKNTQLLYKCTSCGLEVDSDDFLAEKSMCRFCGER